MRISLVAVVASVLAAACSSSSSGTATGTDVTPTNPPPAPNPTAPSPTFTAVYTGILSTRCISCHTRSAGIGITQGKLDMTTQAVAYANLVGAAAAGDACVGKGTRVVAGAAGSSLLYLKVSLDDASPCGEKMPFGGPVLPRGETDLIEAWIDAGAKND